MLIYYYLGAKGHVSALPNALYSGLHYLFRAQPDEGVSGWHSGISLVSMRY